MFGSIFNFILGFNEFDLGFDVCFVIDWVCSSVDEIFNLGLNNYVNFFEFFLLEGVVIGFILNVLLLYG